MRGIESSGLPLLPSRLLYDRGVAYSYAAWLGGAMVTPSLPTYRAVGYIAAVAALVALFSLVRMVASSNAAWLAVALTCVSLPVRRHRDHRAVLRSVPAVLSADTSSTGSQR